MQTHFAAFGASPSAAAASAAELRLGMPIIRDGAHLHALVARCPPLDVNSAYAYLLLCHHFADTCVVARRGNRVVGFISAYRPPADGAVIFVWQVAVDPDERGQNLGNAMLAELLARPALAGIETLETTVTPSNAASRRMFLKFAAARHAALAERPLFAASEFGAAAHEEEKLLRIEGLRTAASVSATATQAGAGD